MVIQIPSLIGKKISMEIIRYLSKKYGVLDECFVYLGTSDTPDMMHRRITAKHIVIDLDEDDRIQGYIMYPKYMRKK
jgi:hypothetical protein